MATTPAGTTSRSSRRSHWRPPSTTSRRGPARGGPRSMPPRPTCLPTARESVAPRARPLPVPTFIRSTLLGRAMGFLRSGADEHNPSRVRASAGVVLYFPRKYAKGAWQLLVEAITLVPTAVGQAPGLQLDYSDPAAIAA